MEKQCLTCQSKFTGRSDKKFCNEACKNEYHNNLSGAKGKMVNSKLASLFKKNRRVLSSLNSNGISVVNKSDLECFGFDFKGITGIEFMKGNKLVLCCFEFNLVQKGNRYLIQKQS